MRHVTGKLCIYFESDKRGNKHVIHNIARVLVFAIQCLGLHPALLLSVPHGLARHAA